MEKRLSVKTLYLLLVIAVGLVVLGVGSTYAIFTASAEINNPITLSSNLTHDSDIMETVNVTVAAGKIGTATIKLSNNSGSNVNYVVWYLDEGNDVIVGTNNGSPTGSLANGKSTSVVVDIKNNSDSTANVMLGVSSGTGTVVLANDMFKVADGFYGSSQFSYDNSKTGVNCSDVTCMLDELYNLVS